MRIKIKTWDEMKNEFGLDRFGSINVKGKFIENMEDLMPRNRIIEISINNMRDYIWLTNENEWLISKYMIKMFVRPYSIYGKRMNFD